MAKKTSHLPSVLSRGVAEVLPSAATLATRMTQGKIRLYLGIDPTGSLLTLGHSIALRKLQEFAELGHEVILLIGNGTVKIGDPTGKDATRPMLTDAEIEANFKNWKQQASTILDFDMIQVRHNGDWLDALTMPEVIKLMAKTTVQQLIERDMFQERMKQGKPIHGHEIMYPMLQGYDSVAMDVDLEIGGTDQTFNMMMGRTLQKIYNNKEKWVLSVPIINGLDGRKMSKSYGNYVALTDEPKEMFGKLMSIADDQIIEYFTLLTDVDIKSIQTIEQAMSDGENPMQFKKELARTITTMYHDAAKANEAEQHFHQAVQSKEVPSDAPVVSLSNIESITVLDMLQQALPDESKSNIRRLMSQSAVEFLPKGYKPNDPAETPDWQEVTAVRVGKRRFFKLELK